MSSNIQQSPDDGPDPRKLALQDARFSETDLLNAQRIGALFGGNGFTHDEQCRLVADLIRQIRGA